MKKIKNDLLLIVFIIILCAAAMLIFRLSLKNGSTVSVNTPQGTQSYSLSDTLSLPVYTEDGNVNSLVIADGKAYIQDASCPDRICVEHRPISKKGETIVCLPHKLVIEIS